MQGNGTRRRSAVKSGCARCRNATAVSRAQLKYSMMPIRVLLKNARVLPWGEASRVQDAVGRRLRRCAEQRCADAARQGRNDASPADEEEEEQQHEVVKTETAARI
jgi:hypothetical protein